MLIDNGIPPSDQAALLPLLTAVLRYFVLFPCTAHTTNPVQPCRLPLSLEGCFLYAITNVNQQIYRISFAVHDVDLVCRTHDLTGTNMFRVS